LNKARLIRLLLAATVMVVAGVLLDGYITDDTYIHLRYAHNLIDYGEFSFNPGESSYGATSPLWIFGLAFFLKLGLAPFAAAKLLGLLSGALVIFVLDAILEKMTFASSWKLGIMLAAVSDVWFLRWTFSGMETPLATALLLVLLWPLFSGRDLGWGKTREPLWVRYLGWGVGAGLAGLVRPELMLMAPLALPWLLWFEYFRSGAMQGLAGRHQARPYAPIAGAIGGWVIVVGPWLLYAWLAFGRITPGTAAAKSSTVVFSLPVFLSYLLQNIQQLALTQGVLWVVVVILIVIVLRSDRIGQLNADTSGWHLGSWTDVESEQDEEPIPAPGIGPWSVWGPVALTGIALTWAATLLGGYAIKQVWIISRYVSPLGPVLLLTMGVVMEWLLNSSGLPQARKQSGKTIILVGLIITLVVNWWILVGQVVPHAQKFPVGVKNCYLGMGEWLSENSAEDAVVAALDIGAIGYASDRRVLDLMGLVSPEILELGLSMGFEEMVASGAWLNTRESGSGRCPDYFIDRSDGAPRWEDKTVHGVRFELIDTCIIEGVGLREPQPWTVALYRLVSVDNKVSGSSGG